MGLVCDPLSPVRAVGFALQRKDSHHKGDSLSYVCIAYSLSKDLGLGLCTGDLLTKQDGHFDCNKDIEFWTHLTVDQHHLLNSSSNEKFRLIIVVPQRLVIQHRVHGHWREVAQEISRHRVLKL